MPRFGKDCANWLRRLHDEIHITSVLVTHDQEEALEVADRVVVMNQAKIEQVGTPTEVFHHPASQFVMEFLGQVNVFQGRIHGGKAILGTGAFDVTPGNHSPTEQATLYVRPHELDIARSSNCVPSLPGRVTRVHTAGPMARVTLLGVDGQNILVDLTPQRFVELNLQPGETVYVSPQKVRVFSPDYQI